jgi:hypothetical protein
MEKYDPPLSASRASFERRCKLSKSSLNWDVCKPDLNLPAFELGYISCLYREQYYGGME